MKSKYVDNSAIIQVIGSTFLNPSLLDLTDKYDITEEDFDSEFHKIVFGTILKLHELGAQKITLQGIMDFLSSKPKYLAEYQNQKGEEWLTNAAQNAQPQAFDYYYDRMKKMSLLRAYDKYGIDVSYIYDPNIILDVKKQQAQEEYLDNATLESIADEVDKRIEQIRYQFVDDCDTESMQAGLGMTELIERLQQFPEVGIPMYGPLINRVVKGARLKKFYLRSAPTGVGKTRTMIADACYFACNRIYDENFGWIKNGTSEPTLYITTEQELEEAQTMMMSFLANVPEEHILDGKYENNELERIQEAIKIISKSPLFIHPVPDFSLQDIEDIIKKGIRDHDVKYVCFDYIHTSLKILEEITRRSGGVKLREDNVLFMLSIRLKDLCNKYGIFIISATQLNSDYQESETPDQNLLRGAKSIADKVDVGEIILPVKNKDKEALSTILSSNAFDTPTLKISVYKNRRGKYKGIYLWCKSDLGTCRVQPMFATTWDYEIVKIDDLKIVTEEPGAFD